MSHWRIMEVEWAGQNWWACPSSGWVRLGRCVMEEEGEGLGQVGLSGVSFGLYGVGGLGGGGPVGGASQAWWSCSV